MTPLVIRLGRHRWLHRVVAALPIYPFADLVLRRFPLTRRIKPGGLTYRVTSLDQLSVQSGLFELNEYLPALDGSHVATFIDLGCNAGWFTLWLATRLPDPPHFGLLVEANPFMASEASWHLKRNGLEGCVVVHGAVGLHPNQTTTTFHLHPSSSASSVAPYQPEKQLPAKGRIVGITVPAVSVADEWRKHFGGAVVDLMKIDIEGLELDFVIYEGAFLREQVRRIVLEWHKWRVSFDDLDTQLISIGFEKCEAYDQSALVGLAVYRNLAHVH